MQPKILWPRFLGVIKSIFWAPGTLKTAAPRPRAARARTTRRLFLVPLIRGQLCSLLEAGGGRVPAQRPEPGRTREGLGEKEGSATRVGLGRPQMRRTLWWQPPGSSQNLSLLPGLFSGSDSCVPGAGIHLLPPVPASTDLWKDVCRTTVYSRIAKNGKRQLV